MVIQLKDSHGRSVTSLGVSAQASKKEQREDKSSNASYSAGVIDDFTGSYAFLHPDAPGCVALPITIGPMGEFTGQTFYPSLSCAVLACYLKYATSSTTQSPDRDAMLTQMMGLQEVPYESEEDCKQFLIEKTDVLKDSLVSENIYTDLQSRETFPQEFLENFEGLLRDRFFRARVHGISLVQTSARPIKFCSDFGRNELLTPQLLYDKKREMSVYDRLIAKVREDLKHPVKGLFRWLYQQVPIELDLKRRPYLFVGDTAGDDVTQQQHDHVLRCKTDQRDYFGTLDIDAHHIFDRFPASEREDIRDDDHIRRQKRQRLADELRGSDRRKLGGSNTDTATSAPGPLPGLLMGFGNTKENEIICPSASRFHCAVVPLVRGVFVVIDFGYEPQTMFNGKPLLAGVFKRVEPAVGRHGQSHTLEIGEEAYVVRCGAMHKDELIRAKRRELEQRLRAIEAEIGSSKSTGEPKGGTRATASDKSHVKVVISNLPGQFSAEDLEAMINQNQLKYTSAPRKSTSYTYVVGFGNRLEAWRAKEFFNNRIVRGRSIIASVVEDDNS